jgi:hypothetical protein
VTPVQALRIPVGGPATVVDLDDDGGGPRFLDSLRAAIGADYVECIAVTDRWTAWLDEDSAARDQPLNQAATQVAGEYGARFRLRGTVVILGEDSRTGASCGLSPDQIDVLRRRIMDEPPH